MGTLKDISSESTDVLLNHVQPFAACLQGSMEHGLDSALRSPTGFGGGLPSFGRGAAEQNEACCRAVSKSDVCSRLWRGQGPGQVAEAVLLELQCGHSREVSTESLPNAQRNSV